MRAPPSVVCPLCGTQDDLDAPTPLPDSVWQFVCRGHHEPSPYLFQASAQKIQSYPEGLATELGLWDDLPPLLGPGEPRVEYGVVEYRYATAHPNEYARLVKEYGHTAQGPKRFTASAFIAKALGRLASEGVLSHFAGPATGYWAYNGTISYWARPKGADDGDPLTWEAFATTGGLDPMDWPPLDYQHPTP